MKNLSELLLTAEEGAKKLGVGVEDFFAHLKREAEHLIGLADDNVDHARDVVLGDAQALGHNVGDALKDTAAEGVEEAQDIQKEAVGKVDAAEGEPVQQPQISPQEPPQAAPASPSE